MYLLNPPQKKHYYEFWEVLKYFGVTRYTEEARQFIYWLTDEGDEKLQNSTMLHFHEDNDDVFGLQDLDLPLVKQVMLKAMNEFGEARNDNSPKTLSLMFYY